MTGVEVLRMYANDGARLMSRESLLCIADQIERETLPRPRFEDGEPVQFGDEFYCGNSQTTVGDTWNVKRMTFYSNGNTIVADDRFSSTMLAPCERLRRPEPPDTWERIEADANTDTCDYNGDECQATMCSDCQLKHRLEIVRRCKALAGVE